MDVTVEPWEEGAAFFIKAHAGSRRDAVTGFYDGHVKVEVTAAPERGKANRALRKYLAARLDVPAAAVELLSGEASPRKRFGVRGVTATELAGKLRAICPA